MAAHQHVGAAAPGLAAPERSEKDEPRGLAGGAGVEVQGTADSPDSAAKLIATATARAALLGIEVHEIDAGAWLLSHARGGDIGTVRGLAALDDAIGGFESALTDVRDLVQRMMRGAA